MIDKQEAPVGQEEDGMMAEMISARTAEDSAGGIQTSV